MSVVGRFSFILWRILQVLPVMLWGVCAPGSCGQLAGMGCRQQAVNAVSQPLRFYSRRVRTSYACMEAAIRLRVCGRECGALVPTWAPCAPP